MANAGNATSDRQQQQKKPLWREYLEAIVIALLLALFIRAFVVQAFSIPSGSMLETLQIGDYLLVNKFSYGIRNPFTNKVLIPLGQPQRGDIVVFIFPPDPSKDFIKRVVAVAGDTVKIVDKKLYVNEQPLDLPQATFKDNHIIDQNDHWILSAGASGVHRDNFGPYTVPPGHVFVMGDNRDHSYDSRFWGPVPLDNVRGKAWLIYFSWDQQKFWPRWGRIGSLVH
ncbi:MAG: signal peptidase I [Desulfobacca sp.]|uniref:signal peptidase I n=1 Tax=Desulfobacca sp. TaxID=2067990 RepID=UPI00404AB6BB